MKLHWSFVLNTKDIQDKAKMSRILRPMEPYENLVIEKFNDPSNASIKAYLDVDLQTEWPAVAVEALQRAVKVGSPSFVFISPEGAANALEGVISTPSMVGVSWAAWSLIP
jgi:hypothetical protein